MITPPKVCPYFSKEAREKWHRERGMEDPMMAAGGLVWKKEVNPVEKFNKSSGEVRPSKQEESAPTKEQRYRLRNREKLAAKARERRAKARQ